ncbi:MAG: AraC family ligand binding domain-containing protein, partial [Pseudomonadota bacterium]
MEITLFRIDAYLRDGEDTHVARKGLADRWPERAHRHDYFEVFLIERGATEHWINGRYETLSPGHVVFIRPEDSHAFCANSKTGCGIINVMVRM